MTCFYLLGKDGPVDFKRVLQHIRAMYPCRREINLNGDQIKLATQAFFDTNALEECSEDFREKLV